MLSSNSLVIIWRGGFHLKLYMQGQESGDVLDVDGQGGLRVLKIEQFSGT